jgi:hypothetical protein
LSTPIGAITEISTKGFTLGVKKANSLKIYPLYDLDLGPRQKKRRRIVINFGGQFATLESQCYDNKILSFR